MKKYIDAEKLIAEIERLAKINKQLKPNRFTQGIAGGYADVLSAITSLQQEQPEVDLEEEADRLFFSLGWYEGDHDQPMLDCISLEEFRGIARHFYGLGLNAKEENK